MFRLIKVCVIAISFMMISTLTVQAEPLYDFTLLIYMNGSDLETDYQAATDDLLEMIEGRVGDHVAVIIETGGTNQWFTSSQGLPAVSGKVNQRWQLTDDSMTFLGSVGTRNMGDPETLSNFLDYGMSHYASDQYGLVMWNHGAGAIYGYGADEKFDYDTLTLPEMQAAFEDNYTHNQQRFDFIGFDACLMASLETAHVLAPYASYLIGSEELEPGHGWAYGSLLDYLSSDVDPNSLTVGETVIEAFKAHSIELGTSDAITMSLIDLSKIEAVAKAVDQLTERVLLDLEVAGMEASLLKARLASESYGEGNSASDIPDSDMVDLVDYATSLNEFYPYQAESLVLAVYDAVILHINSDYKPKARGLSMYVPAKDKETMLSAAAVMEDIGMSHNHVAFIDEINRIINSDHKAVDYEDAVTDVSGDNETMVTLENNSIEGNDQFYYFQVNKEDLASISEINTIMGRLDDGGDIQYLARDVVDDEAIMDDGTIVGETLEYWVQVNGISVAMYYESHSDHGVINYYIPILLNGQEADLIVLISQTYPTGKILGARRLNSDNENVYNRSLMTLDENDVIEFVYEFDAYNILRDDYRYDGWYVVDEIYVGNGLTLGWIPLSSGDYAYAFEIIDIYGNTYQTDWITYTQEETSLTEDRVDDAIWDNFEVNVSEEDSQFPWLVEGVQLPSEWAIPYINTAYNNGLTTGKTLQDFHVNINREAFCELVVKLYENAIGRPVAVASPVVFTDTNNLSVAKAYELGIVGGYGDGRFGPEDDITREQLIAMFYRALVRLDNYYGTLNHPELTYKDVDLIASWALKPTISLVDYGIIDGVGDNRLAPKNKATVEQALKLVNSLYEFYLTNQPKG